MALLSLLLLFTAFSAAQIGQGYYGGTGGISQDTSFSVPEYDSQEEVVTQLVLPFLFVTILLQFILTRVMHSILRDNDGYPQYPGIPYRDDTPNLKKYTTLMSVSITGILVPSPLWDYIRFAISGLGAVAVAGFFAMVLFVLYLMAGFGGNDNG